MYILRCDGRQGRFASGLSAVASGGDSDRLAPHSRRPHRGRLQKTFSPVAGVGDPGREHPCLACRLPPSAKPRTAQPAAGARTDVPRLGTFPDGFFQALDNRSRPLLAAPDRDRLEFAPGGSLYDSRGDSRDQQNQTQDRCRQGGSAHAEVHDPSDSRNDK